MYDSETLVLIVRLEDNSHLPIKITEIENL